jgi:hypothetical protein
MTYMYGKEAHDAIKAHYAAVNTLALQALETKAQIGDLTRKDKG